jgi:hypothetical protein
MVATVDQAIEFIAEVMRTGSRNMGSQYSDYGYDIYLPTVLHLYGVHRLHLSRQEFQAENQAVQSSWPAFADAAWVLSRRGVLRPGVREFRGQGTDAGQGYSITGAGRAWLRDNKALLVPSDPSRFADAIEKYAKRFGLGFHRRAIEAIKCHEAGSYLATCAIAGAAAEAALLDIAAAKKGDREAVVATYLSRSGRKEITGLVLAGLVEPLNGQLRVLLDLLSFWRDTAAHGMDHDYTEVEAYDALSKLLRLAILTGERWTEITGKA